MYEITFILNDESETKNIKSLLESLEGKITEEKAWGERELAYPVQKLRSAKYFTWTFTIPPKNLAELKRKLNFNEKMIRFLLLKLDIKKLKKESTETKSKSN